jgi:uncharacterized protein YndB with AHSA1/START domain
MYKAETSMVINAPVEKVWEALTTPEIVKKYLFGTEMKTSWKVGDPISYSGVWEGKPYEDKGTVVAYEPMKQIVTTYWSPASGLPDLPENYQMVTYSVSSDVDGTKVTVTQSNAKTQESADHSVNNWNMVLGELKKLLES